MKAWRRDSDENEHSAHNVRLFTFNSGVFLICHTIAAWRV
ncbi:hypothetical protein BN128_4173 [Cronobacter sakazakii 696]|nr:hypothetical protein BN128_4173 [Cronobacter sakazakii 696]